MTSPILIQIVQFFPIPSTQLWHTLTQVDQMRQWFIKEIHSFEPQIGFQTEFLVSHLGKPYTHYGLVQKVPPNQMLQLDWSYKEYKGNMEVVFLLDEVSECVELTLNSTITEPFPDEEIFSYSSIKKGWTGLIQNQLVNFIKKI